MGRLARQKRLLIEQTNKRLLGESVDSLFNDEFDKLYIPNFCKKVMQMEQSRGWRDLSRVLRNHNEVILRELKSKNIINISTENELNEFIGLLPNRIYRKCSFWRNSNMTKGAVENTNKKILYSLIPEIFEIKKTKGNTEDVANFEKENVTDDLAKKTTIKDGKVHVPFAIDDFPKEDWDLYFEDFEVSNKKFGFTDYIVKEYGAGEVDSEEIWKEYQEAILHRLMNEG